MGHRRYRGWRGQYLPKSSVFEHVSHQKTNQVMQKINPHPREKLISLLPMNAFTKSFCKFAMAI
jgi:IS30 family transposase